MGSDCYCSLLWMDKSWLINEPVCTHAFPATIVVFVVLVLQRNKCFVGTVRDVLRFSWFSLDSCQANEDVKNGKCISDSMKGFFRRLFQSVNQTFAQFVRGKTLNVTVWEEGKLRCFVSSYQDLYRVLIYDLRCFSYSKSALVKFFQFKELVNCVLCNNFCCKTMVIKYLWSSLLYFFQVRVAENMVSANRWLRSIKTNAFPW